MSRPGHYSLIQFVPDPARAEGVNVGVVVLRADLGYLGAKLAYRNGRVNLVQPRLFPSDPDRAFRSANDLAVQGHALLRRHPDQPRLIVVSAFETDAARDALSERIEAVMEDLDTEVIRPEERPAFYDRVEREAQPFAAG